MRHLIRIALAATLLLPGAALAQVAGLPGDLSVPITTHGPHTTGAGDVSARNIYATGGKLVGVDATAALVGGQPLGTVISQALAAASAAQTAAQGAMPASAAAGFAKLGPTGLLAPGLIPAASSSVLGGVMPDGVSLGINANGQLAVLSGASGTDSVARASANAATTTANQALGLAQASVPLATGNTKGGYAQLDQNALIPPGLINPASAATDNTARSTANAAASTANAAQSLAGTAVQQSTANAKGGYPQLDQNAQVPTGLINPASVATDPIARSTATNASSAANSAQSTASTAVQQASGNQKNGYAQLDQNALVPPGLINPASVATNPTARANAANAASAASAAQNTAAGAVPSSTANAKGGYAQLDQNALVPPALINPASVATDPTARTNAGNALSAANAAQSAANSAVQTSSANAKNGYAQLDANALVPAALINPASAATDTTARNAASNALSVANADSAFLTSQGVPSVAQGKTGDNDLNLATNELYAKGQSGWQDTGVNLKGTPGQSATYVTAVPANTSGANGDSAVLVPTGEVYSKVNGSWTDTGQNVLSGAVRVDANGTLGGQLVQPASDGASMTLASLFDQQVFSAQYMKCDREQLTGMVFSSGTNTATDPPRPFTPADVGKIFLGAYETNGALRTITAVDANGTAHFSGAAWPGASNSSGSSGGFLATDDTNGIIAAFAHATTISKGARLTLQRGQCAFTAPIVVRDNFGLQLVGASMDGSQFVSMAPNAGIRILMLDGASFTGERFSVVKSPFANQGTLASGTGFYVGDPHDPNPGHLTLHDVAVDSNYTFANIADVWNVDFEIENVHNASVDHLIAVGSGNKSNFQSADLPAPSASSQTFGPSIQVGTGNVGYFIHGHQHPGSSYSGNSSNDNAYTGVEASGVNLSSAATAGYTLVIPDTPANELIGNGDRVTDDTTAASIASGSFVTSFKINKAAGTITVGLTPPGGSSGPPVTAQIPTTDGLHFTNLGGYVLDSTFVNLVSVDNVTSEQLVNFQGFQQFSPHFINGLLGLIEFPGATDEIVNVVGGLIQAHYRDIMLTESTDNSVLGVTNWTYNSDANGWVAVALYGGVQNTRITDSGLIYSASAPPPSGTMDYGVYDCSTLGNVSISDNNIGYFYGEAVHICGGANGQMVTNNNFYSINSAAGAATVPTRFINDLGAGNEKSGNNYGGTFAFSEGPGGTALAPNGMTTIGTNVADILQGKSYIWASNCINLPSPIVGFVMASSCINAGDGYLISQTGNFDLFGPNGAEGSLGPQGISVPYLADSVATGVTAAGTTQATATLLTAANDTVTSCPSGSGLALPTTAPIGATVQLYLRDPSNGCNMFPPPGGSEVIEGANANAAVAITQGSSPSFTRMTATQWREKQ